MVAVTMRSKNGKSNRWLKIAAAFVVLTLSYLSFTLKEAFKEDETHSVKNHITNLDSAIIDTSPPATVKCSNDTKLPPSSTERNFRDIAEKTGTDKVAGYKTLPGCLENPETCTRKECKREKCRPWGHFYDTIYDRWLKKYSSDDAEEIQFLEIGYYNGKGFDAYSEFLPRAEKHSMEISCLPPGPRSEGKWPEQWGNFASKNPQYESLREARRLHCGDASDYDFLLKIWAEEMKRPDSPPLKVVVDDGSHISTQMAASLFFWLPRIEPGGILVMEDIQPIGDANEFRTHILPQVIKDLHWCGNELKEIKDTRCFPTIQPLLMSVHCEMHICVFERNDTPALEPSKEDSLTPPDAFTNAQKCLFGPH